MSRPSKVVVIAEDDRTHRFVWTFLKRLHYKRHHYQPKRLPSGCGEQFVREEFAKEVAALRSRAASTVLIAVVDADNSAVHERFRQLDGSLRENNMMERTESEPIAILIPKRNIETWICCLAGQPVNEAEDYKPRSGSAGDARMAELLRRAAEVFYEKTRPNSPGPSPSIASLDRAIPEARRVPNAN